MLLAMTPALLQSQPIYRCGNSYGQAPCADGVVIDAQDSRTAAQKAQTDAATVQAARQADRMERERLAVERRTIAATERTEADRRKPPAATRATHPPARGTTPKPASRPKARAGEADYFTAAARSDDPTRKAAARSPRD